MTRPAADPAQAVVSVLVVHPEPVQAVDADTRRVRDEADVFFGLVEEERLVDRLAGVHDDPVAPGDAAVETVLEYPLTDGAEFWTAWGGPSGAVDQANRRGA